MSRSPPRWLFVVLVLKSTAILLVVAVLVWGPWRQFFANPARLLAVVASVLFAVVGCSSDVNLSAGRREDTRSRWIFVPFILYSALISWLPPYGDSRDIFVLDGDAVRYAGLLLFLIGGVLRVAPMFVLGKRFSGLVAIQEQHELVTDGLCYGIIRHPSFLGAALAVLGWVLVFRSAVGLLLTPLATPLLVARLDAEEALLASEFGAAYEAYRRRTWRLIPWVY